MKRMTALMAALILLLSGCAAKPQEGLPVLDAVPREEAPAAATPETGPEPPKTAPISANEAIESGQAPDPEKDLPYEMEEFEAPPTYLETAPPDDLEPLPVLPPELQTGGEETPGQQEPQPPSQEESLPEGGEETQPGQPPEEAPPEPPQETPPEPEPEIDLRFALSQNVGYDAVYQHLYALTKQIGSRRVGTSGNAAARQYLLDRLAEWGFSETDGTLWKQGFYSTGDLYTENIIASIPGNGASPAILVMSAHFDSVRDTEGAVDNASGVAALLEAARAIKQSGLQYNFEIRFCFFSAEEDGYKGAIEYIRRQSAAELSNHIVFNVDMAGYANDGRPHALVVSTKGDPSTSDWRSAEPNVISGAIVKAYYSMQMNYARYYSPTNAGKHDIVPFYARGIPCATLSLREIDFRRAFGNDLGIAAPWLIHTWSDTLEMLNVDSVVEICRLMVLSTAYIHEAYG